MRSLSSLLVCAFLTAKCRWFSRCVFLSGLALACSPRLAAQEAAVVGTVIDQTGGLLPGVTITITNPQTGATRTLVTNRVGQYVASGLTIGTYDLRAESPAFAVEESSYTSQEERVEESGVMFGGPARTRTGNRRIMSPTL